MITYAFLHKEEVQKKLTALVASPAGKFYFPNPCIDEQKIDDSTWAKLQLVAVYDGKVQGFFSAAIDRHTLNVTQIAMAKFTEDHEIEMATVVARCFRFLRVHFRNIQWSGSVGSPTEEIYRRIAIEHGGREIGRFTAANKLRDGRLVDGVWFEVPAQSGEPDGLTELPEEFSQ